MAEHFLTRVPDLDMDNLLPILDGAGQLRVDALADEDDLDQCEVSQVRPADSSENVKLLVLEVRHEAKGEPVGVCLGSHHGLQSHGVVRVLLGMQILQVTVKDEQTRCDGDQEQRQCEVLDQEVDELAGAHALFFDQEVVLAAALFAVDALANDDLCCLAVHVHLFARALTRLAEPRRDLDVLQV